MKKSNELFKDFAMEFFGTTLNGFGAVNIKETDKNYELAVLAPGLTREQINIEIEDRYIIISSEFEDKDEYRTCEFSITPFSRHFKLPKHHGDINAQLVNGILTITINKKDREKINIQ